MSDGGLGSRALRASRAAVLACGVLLVACDQFAVVGVQRATLADSGPPGDGPPTMPADAMTELDAMTSEPDAMMPMADAATDAGADAAAACSHDQIQICNPITNEINAVQGCPPELGQQCAIDQLQVLTGYCLFASPDPPALGGACFNSGVTESCAATSACAADGICRKICLCDADCGAGQCCTMPVGATGFSVCSDC